MSRERAATFFRGNTARSHLIARPLIGVPRGRRFQRTPLLRRVVIRRPQPFKQVTYFDSSATIIGGSLGLSWNNPHCSVTHITSTCAALVHHVPDFKRRKTMKLSKRIPMWLTIDVAIILVGMVIIAGGIWTRTRAISVCRSNIMPAVTQRGPWDSFLVAGWYLI